MGQLNQSKQATFTPPPYGMLGAGWDLLGNFVRIESDGSPTIIIPASATANTPHIIANKGVGAAANRPSSAFFQGDVYVSNDTFTVSVASDTVSWSETPLILNQLVTNTLSISPELYQFTGTVLIQFQIGIYKPATQPAITASVLTIDCKSRNQVIVEPTPRPETSNFSIVFSNVTNTDVVQVVLQLTGTIIITMPSNVKVSIPSSIGVWDNILKTLTMSAGTADEIGFNFLWNKSGLFWDLAVGEVAI